MMALRKRSPITWVAYGAMLFAGFETGRGLARLERGEEFFPALPLPSIDACCAVTANFAPLLA